MNEGKKKGRKKERKKERKERKKGKREEKRKEERRAVEEEATPLYYTTFHNFFSDKHHPHQ